VNFYEPLMKLSMRIRDLHEPFVDPQKVLSGTRCVSWVYLTIFRSDPKCELL
jgi:hypothetical protein